MSDTVFKKVDYQLGKLVADIELGEIGLPDIQRPFVWEDSKIRDLFDSMYRGYPVGHLLFWESGAEPGARQIGSNEKQLAPKLLIVDGQQRLTSLFAVMKRRPVIGKDYTSRQVRIAFRPRDGVFSVADAATDKDPAFLPDISAIWTRPAFTVITEFMAHLQETDALLAGDDETIPAALNRLEALKTYPFTALVLGAEIAEEQVAEVFVRINSKGKNLNQADFILTLMSVFWDEGRTELETWSRQVRSPSDPAWNRFLSPAPDQLLRVAIGLGFRRGRLEDAYAVLRGRDPRTGKISPEARDEQFARLAAAQAKVLDKAVWKEFLQCLVRAGHRSAATISSKNAVLYSYALYLIGKHEYGVKAKPLRDVMARFFFMSSITGRYSGSPESTFESDIQSLPAAADPDAFVGRLDDMVAQRLTPDYWNITLPGELATSASRSPSLFAYHAAMSILGAPVLFSKMSCSELLDPALAGASTKAQRHHLFPKHYLEQHGISDIKQTNQIANLALLEWHDNLSISATDPTVYWPAYLDAMKNPPSGAAPFSDAEIDKMVHLHGLPDDWPSLAYEDFLDLRRRNIAGVIREAFEKLQHGESDETMATWPPSQAAIMHILAEGETGWVEMKSSLRADTLDRGIPPKALEKIVARTVAGFLNSHGGLLVIGADDLGTPLGLSADLATLQKKSLDGFQQTLVQVLVNYLGAASASCVRIHIAQVGPGGLDIALVDCQPHTGPVFLSDGNSTEFHVRYGNTTRHFNVQEAAAYIAQHWKGAA